MIPLARRDEIAARLAGGQAVVAATLASEFGVSEDAIRRDLRSLAAEGRCRRVYGGALPISPASGTIIARVAADPQRKAALARRAAGLALPGEVVFIDSGSTNLPLIAALPDDARLTVITNSVHLAAAAVGHPGMKLVLIGGAVDADVGGCVDAEAILAVQRLSVDRCFLGACAISTTRGISAFSHQDATFKRVLISVSRHRVVMATNDKLQTQATFEVAPLADVDSLVLEHDAPEDLRSQLADQGAAVLSAAPAN